MVATLVKLIEDQVKPGFRRTVIDGSPAVPAIIMDKRIMKNSIRGRERGSDTAPLTPTSLRFRFRMSNCDF